MIYTIYIHNVTGKVPGCLYAACMQYLRPVHDQMITVQQLPNVTFHPVMLHYAA